jgi:DNA polymerase III epsilon subunit-like protein
MSDRGHETSERPSPLRHPRPDGAVVDRVAVIDLETGGLDPSTDPVLQVAVVGARVEPGLTDVEITDEWCTTVRLDRPWQRYGARHIHGIGRHRLLLAPGLPAVMRQLADRCGDRVIVAHNISFDWSFILAASRRTGIAPPPGDHLCTLELSRSLDPERSTSHRLVDIAARLGLDHPHAHDALGDARTTARVLPRLLAARLARDTGRGQDR